MMMFWLRQIYGLNFYFCSLICLPTYKVVPTTIWAWRLLFSGLCCDELYYRIIETTARRLLIIPSIFLFDKFLANYYNNFIVSKFFNILHKKVLRIHLTPLYVVRFILLVFVVVFTLFNFLIFI